MKDSLHKIPKLPLAVFFAALSVLIVAGGYGWYRVYTLSHEFASAKQDFASTTAAFELKVSGLEQTLALAQNEGLRLGSELAQERGKTDNLNSQLENVSNTVSVLQKRINLDPELLQKYSKIFFLNENYTPSSLTDITSSEWVYQTGKAMQIHTNVWPFLQRMLQAAKQEGVDIEVLSAYRSFKDQSSLKANYKVVYGSGANQFSADQGYSEHQLGTTVDLTTPILGSAIDKFKPTAAYVWLLAKAHNYGFVLSYPEGNTYYQFEPWHWRFVGTALATRLFEDKKHFYDLDQRLIDQYLVTIFD